MKKPSRPISALHEELQKNYRIRRQAIRIRLSEFAAVQPSEYFYELVYCLLTPQSSALHAEQVVAHLMSAEFRRNKINPEPMLRQKDCYIRFHRTKARHLLQMKEHFSAIAPKLAEPISAIEMREWLVDTVLGLGYKEASHFLRNIGKNDGLAILDRHILRNLHRFGVIRTIPKTIGRKQYLDIEKRFSGFAIEIGIALDELDLLFWSMETGEIRK
jgi:N-glycosylase/DNA lyase